VEGTRKIGLAGSSQPFHEGATAQVSRVGGTDKEPEMRVLTESSSATTEETRRYTSTSVDLLTLRASSTGLAYGGTFTTPQLLLRNPIRVGDSWTSRWDTEGTKGTTTAAVTGTRTVSLAGHSFRCYLVERQTTMSGDVTGTQRQRACWVAELGMAFQDDQELRGTYHGLNFDARVQMTLRAAPAAPSPTELRPSEARALQEPPTGGRAPSAVERIGAAWNMPRLPALKSARHPA
jgi:hypothetical protein